MKQHKLLHHALLYYDFILKQCTYLSFPASEWLNLTAQEFNNFRMDQVPHLLCSGGTGSSSTTAAVAAHGNVTSVQVHAFSSAHKHDVKSYAKFNGTLKNYFCTMCQWRAQACVNEVECIFNPSTNVPPVTTEDYCLWNLQQAFVMSVLNHCVQGGQAQAILCQYSSLGDAHNALSEIITHYTANGNISSLCTEFHCEIATLCLTPKYSGGPTCFLQDFQSLYLDLEEAMGTPVSEEEKVGQLTACVQGHPHFSSLVQNLTLIATMSNTTVSYIREPKSTSLQKTLEIFNSISKFLTEFSEIFT